MTFDECCVIDMIYTVDPQTRWGASFVCGHKTACVLRKIVDQNGRFLWADGLAVGEVSRLLGYPVYIDDRWSGFAFGEFQALPNRVGNYINDKEPKNA
jgi:HK97 family phage major capsid protein